MKEVSLDEKNYKRYLKFYEHYELQTQVDISKLSRKTKLNGEFSVCRFCQRQSPAVSFKSKAHIIPQSLGNRYLISGFECDSCNGIFSKYENSFVNYLGIYRTLTQTKGKKGTGIPKYKDTNSGVSAEVSTEDRIQLNSSEEDSVNFNPARSTLTIKSTKDVYVPLHLFKLLTKIGLSLLPNDELTNFEKTRKFLIAETTVSEVGKSAFQMIKYFIPGPIINKYPSAYIYKLKRSNDKLPAKLFAFQFANLVFQIIIPFNALDDHLFIKNLKIEVPILPLRIDKSWFEKYGDYALEVLDQSSSEQRYNESNDVTFTMTTFKKVTAANTG